MVTVRFDFAVASVEDGEWKHKERQISDMLNATRPAMGVSSAEPDIDYALAEIAIDKFGGKMLTDLQASVAVTGRIY